MTKEDIIRNLKYTIEKHKNDRVDTFGTNISTMCADILTVLDRCIEIPEGATNGDMIKAIFPNCVIDEDFGGAVITNIDNKQYWRKEWWNSPYRKE